MGCRHARSSRRSEGSALTPVLVWALTLVSVTAGATLQRVTGVGFALVSGPAMVLLLGPLDGVVLANLMSACVCVLVLSRLWRSVDRRLAGALLLGVLPGVPAGALVVRLLDERVLLLVVGGVATLAVCLALSRRPLRVLQHRAGPVLAGAVSGFSNVTAGVGSPALAVYAASTALIGTTFVATAQLVSLATNVFSLLVKHHLDLPLPLVLACLGALPVGMLVGSVLYERIPPQHARGLVLGVALVGSLAAVGKGLWQLALAG
ncbi:TSUP family transporter [Auraticoccus sp. F435]|uniref:Probable membrane transporter protein n=1 Tax=Auraticoccus cholistanensis TaxID=2656650 RepID=A0A6A9UV00_9ACTN|nr:sulfite exporter TauE/SafE family protein [Auraticoccus cholistanensis]MVA76498.1 TSUP family transporter [Auraticoccus cholistanensis]